MGFSQVVINISHLGGQIRGAIGDGGDYGVGVLYSEEDSPLETAGGVRLALERGLLDWDEPFALVNGDILTDYDFGRLRGGLGEDRGDVGDRRVGCVGWYWFRIRRSIWGGIFRWMAGGDWCDWRGGTR